MVTHKLKEPVHVANPIGYHKGTIEKVSEITNTSK